MTTKTEGPRALGFLLSEANGNRSRDNITIVSGAGVLVAGTVLGKITASDKYTDSPATGADGSQTAVAVLAYDVDATSADVKTVGITRDAEIKVDELTYEGTVDDATKKTAKATQLAAVGIIVR